MTREEDRQASWERQQAELWDRIFQVTQDVVTLAEGLEQTAGLGYVRHELLRSAMGVGAHLVRANGAEREGDFRRHLTEARMKAIEADYWLRLIYVLQQNASVHQDLSSVISQFSSIIRLIHKYSKHTQAANDAMAKHVHGPKVVM